MRRFVVALLSATVLSVTVAQAADLPVKAPVFTPIVAPPYSWTGFYVGADVGGGWGHHDRRLVPNTFANSYNSSGVIGGIHAGYNWQMLAFIAGIEADINLTGIKGDDGGAGGTLDSTKLKWLGSLRGRVGIPFGRVLIFTTGGWAFGGLEHFNNGGAGQTFTKTRSGWTVGSGVEYGLTPRWTIRVDYRYYDLGTYQNLAPSNGVAAYEVDNTFHTVTAGVSYRF